MQRRSFLKNTGLAGILAAGSAPAFAQTPTIKWRCASSFPKSLDTIYGAADVFSKLVSSMSGGKFQITVATPGEIVPALTTWPMVWPLPLTSPWLSSVLPTPSVKVVPTLRTDPA